jgi:hypothetical protein
VTPPERRRGLGRAGGRRGAGAGRAPAAAPSFAPPANRTTPQVCYLHVGTMKSGTTFLQHMLNHHREALAADGVLFPGRGRYGQQINAVRDFLELPGVVPAAKLAGAWDELRAEIAQWPGDSSIVSVEQLSVAPAKRIPELIESLAPATVHVVVTARDMARVLPSTWQENIQNGLTWTWPDFLASVMKQDGADPKAGDRFWRQHDLVQLVRRWVSAVPAERIHLVTLPPPGAPPDLLWERFCGVVGLDAGRYPADSAALRSNQGLDRASAEMLRRVNVLLGDGVDPAAKQRILKRGLAKSTLADLGKQLPIVLDDDQYAWSRDYSTRLVTRLGATGIDVVGDLAELVPPERAALSAEDVREPTESEITSAATAAAAVLLLQDAEPAAPRARRASTR